MRPRWDVDERGHGVADARALLPRAEALVAAMDEPLWVAEQPEAHLLPHLGRASATVPVELVEAPKDGAGTLVVELRWTEAWDSQAATAAAFTLLGAIAEEMTYASKEETADAVVLEAATGVVSDGEFAPHGHTVRLRIARA